MKDLVIVTTKPQYLPGSSNEKILFKRGSRSPDRTHKGKGKAEVYSKYRHQPDKLFWLDDDEHTIVFGTSCLHKEMAEGAIIPDKEKPNFITNLFKDAIEALSADDRKAIARVFFIVHGFDIGVDDRGFKEVKRPGIVADLNKDDILSGRKIEEGSFQKKYNEEEVGVFFVAFSHVPNRHALYDILANYNEVFKGSTLSPGQMIVRMVSFECGVMPEEEWMKSWESPRGINLAKGFDFQCHHVKDITITSVPKQSGLWFNNVLEILTPNEDSKQIVNVVFVSLPQLSAHTRIFIEFLKKLFSTFALDANPRYPTLFVGYKDIMSDENKAVREGIRLDRRYRFLDSSIWFRYVALENFEVTLTSALNTFSWAYFHKLYEKNVCREYVEFNTRLVEQSKLKNYGDGHSLNIFPFVFHSESKMEQNANRFDKKFREKKLKWNFLLIDDYAKLELREGESRPGAMNQHQKGSIVEALVNTPPNTSQDAKEAESLASEFERCSSVPKAVEDFFQDENISPMAGTKNGPDKSKRFLPDIILLDYLFSEPRESQHFGTDLLRAIVEKKAVRGRSVSQKYWIHPISVFNEAMLSEMLEKSYQHFEPDWYLARGADPINTPHLFRCSLLEFMDVQSELLLFDQKELWDFLIKQNIKNTEDEDSNSLNTSPINQNNTLNAFRNFLEQFSADEGIDAQSAIGLSAKQYMLYSGDKDARELRDHLRKILFLFAYTAGFDFPAIEREFKQIDRIYRAYYSDIQSKEDSETKERLFKLKTAMDTLAEWVYSFSDKYA